MRRRDHERAADREDHELDDVQQVHGGRDADAVDRPVLRERLDPLQVGQLLPLLDLDRAARRESMNPMTDIISYAAARATAVSGGRGGVKRAAAGRVAWAAHAGSQAPTAN